MKEVLRVKFRNLIVTESNKDYEGSITLDPELCRHAHLHEYDMVEVNNYNGFRDRTYVLFGEPDSGCCQVNGALTAHHKKGDTIHVLAYEIVENHKHNRPRIITTQFKDGKNIPD